MILLVDLNVFWGSFHHTWVTCKAIQIILLACSPSVCHGYNLPWYFLFTKCIVWHHGYFIFLVSWPFTFTIIQGQITLFVCTLSCISWIWYIPPYIKWTILGWWLLWEAYLGLPLIPTTLCLVLCCGSGGTVLWRACMGILSASCIFYLWFIWFGPLWTVYQCL